MGEPTTEAGRRVWARHRMPNLTTNYSDITLDEIIAIEREAHQPAPSAGLRDAAQEYFEASLPLLNDYPLTSSESLRAWERLRKANTALRVSLLLAEAAPSEGLRDADVRSLLWRILTSSEYDKMEAEGLAADALGLRWDESRDRFVGPDALAEQPSEATDE